MPPESKTASSSAASSEGCLHCDGEPPPFEDVSGGDECISREDFDAAFVVDQDSPDWDSLPGGMTNDNCLDRNEFADVWSNAGLGFDDHGGQDGSGSHYPAFEDLDADGDLCISEAEAGCPCSSEGSQDDCDRCSELSAIAGGDDCISPEDWDVFTSGSVHGGGDGSDDGSGICAEAVCVHVVRARACHHSAPTPV